MILSKHTRGDIQQLFEEDMFYFHSDVCMCHGTKWLSRKPTLRNNCKHAQMARIILKALQEGNVRMRRLKKAHQ